MMHEAGLGGGSVHCARHSSRASPALRPPVRTKRSLRTTAWETRTRSDTAIPSTAEAATASSTARRSKLDRRAVSPLGAASTVASRSTSCSAAGRPRPTSRPAPSRAGVRWAGARWKGVRRSGSSPAARARSCQCRRWRSGSIGSGLAGRVARVATWAARGLVAPTRSRAAVIWARRVEKPVSAPVGIPSMSAIPLTAGCQPSPSRSLSCRRSAAS